MTRDLYKRVVVPIVLSVTVVVCAVAAVALFALILLYNTHETALVITALTAAGILFVTALAASRDGLAARQRAVLVGAGLLPVAIGASFALGLFVSIDPALLNINAQPQQDPAISAGQQVAASYGCTSCHTTDGTAAVGPTWQNLWGSEVTLNSGETVTVDRDYITRSIREPDAFAREGFDTGVMPELDVSDDEIEDLIAYMQSLSDEVVDDDAGDRAGNG